MEVVWEGGSVSVCVRALKYAERGWKFVSTIGLLKNKSQWTHFTKVINTSLYITVSCALLHKQWSAARA